VVPGFDPIHHTQKNKREREVGRVRKGGREERKGGREGMKERGREGGRKEETEEGREEGREGVCVQ
jgi:hypothetical protein